MILLMQQNVIKGKKTIKKKANMNEGLEAVLKEHDALSP
jgi:hypothetical protein